MLRPAATVSRPSHENPDYTISHVEFAPLAKKQKTDPKITMSPAKALVSGPGTPRLWEQTLGDLIQQQKTKYGDHAAAVFSWQQNHILSYDDLSNRSEMLARSMLARGLKHGDNIAIMAGNCYQYIEVFLASARIGCPLDVLNNTYTSKELVSALKLTCKLRAWFNFECDDGADMNDAACKLLFIASRIKLKDLSGHIEAVTAELESLPCILISSDGTTPVNGSKLCTYSSFTAEGQSTTAAALRQAESLVKCGDVLNLQFTSGESILLSRKDSVNVITGQRHHRRPKSSYAHSQVVLRSFPTLPAI